MKPDWADTEQRYGKISRINHWTLALLMISMLAFGVILADMPKSAANKSELIGLHKSIGVLILVLGLWRVIWRVKQHFPKPVAVLKKWEKVSAHIVHGILLIAILGMPISGYLMSAAGGYGVSFFGLFDLPTIPENEALAGIAHKTHEILGWLTITIVSIHVLAALKHQFINKDATLRRMLGRD